MIRVHTQHPRLRRLAIGVAVAALALATATGSVVAQAGLAIGGSASNFGNHRLRGGFTPDPYTTRIVSGGRLDASQQGLPSGCRGFVTRQPDFIVHYESPADLLRFYATASGDTTLVINDAAGRWHCNDDSHGGVNPSVDIRNPRAGQYDVWVGSYRAGENLRSTLHVTELSGQHP